jgi:hypothetical protein
VEEVFVTRSFFAKPVVVWLDPKRRDFGTMAIQDVSEGLVALHRYGLGEFRMDKLGRPRREWEQAAGALVLAREHPSPANVEQARAALERLARAAGSLAAQAPSRARPLDAFLGWRRLA